MRNEQLILFAAEAPAASDVAGGSREVPGRQRMRGVAGQLRPYRDVRAGFEPWRRLALAEWAVRDEVRAAH